MIEQLIIASTPLIVLGVGELVKLVNKEIKGVWLLMLVAASSGVIAFVEGLILNPDLGNGFIFLYGLLAVFVNQFFKQLNSGN